MHFRREEIDSFYATDYDFDPASGKIQLRYALSGSGGVSHTFCESIDLGRRIDLDPSREKAFDRVVRLLHAVAGTSYFKAAAPPVVHIDSGPLTQAELTFVEDVYDKGLREFAHKNGIPIPLAVEVRADIEALPPITDGAPVAGIGVPIGGGKDSIVVVEALRDLDPVLVAVNPSPAALRTAHTSGLQLASIRRTIDRSLLDLNDAGALNGHVPITAIVSLVCVAAGYAFDYSTTVMALEGSADEPTRLVDGVEINHQWSKSNECEVELREALTGITPGIAYGSTLRDLSELEIAGAFAQLPRYFQGFRSCNKNFSLTGPVDGWCNDCPKCRFVFLMLATQRAPADLKTIFGTDLLAEADQVPGFIDLLDVHRKPFECVGTREESIDAFIELSQSPNWADAVVVHSAKPYLDGAKKSGSRRSPAQVFESVRETVRSMTVRSMTEGSGSFVDPGAVRSA
jgi:UDP-N-acetyl-alpha-D-muramoyl-L-alanyl-L-glutamate epimerase